MGNSYRNRLRCSITNAPGASGNITIGSAYPGRRSFTAADDGKTFDVAIEDGSAWEVRGNCTYVHASQTLTRGTLLDSSTGSAITLTSSALVECSAHAAWAAELDACTAQSVSVANALAPTSDLLSTTTRKRVYVSPSGARMRSDATASAAGTKLLPEHRPLCEKATIAIVGNSIVGVGGAPKNFFGGTGWASGATIALNAVCYPICWDFTAGLADIKWVCTTAGTTGTLEPSWNHAAAIGTTVTDGSVVWTAQNLADNHRWEMGWWHLAQAMTGQRLVETHIVSASGKQSVDILPYVDRFIDDNGVGIVFFSSIFENDVWAGAAPSLATVSARWDAFVVKADACRAMGKKVIVQTLMPSGFTDGSAAFTGYVAGNGTKAWIWLNNKIREFARQRVDVILWDAALVYLDSNPSNPVWPENTVTYLSYSATGQGLKKTDGVHPQGAANFLLAKSLAAVLSANFQARELFSTHGDADNQTVNPLCYGTAGTRDASIGSGTVPNNLTMIAYGGTAGSCVASSVPRTDISGNWARLVYVASAGDNANINWTASQAPVFSAGTPIQVFSEVRVKANPTTLKGVQVLARFIGATNQWVYSNLPAGTDQDWGQFITDDTTFVLKSVPLVMPSGCTGVSIYTKAGAYGSASFTVDFGRSAVMRRNQPAAVS